MSHYINSYALHFSSEFTIFELTSCLELSLFLPVLFIYLSLSLSSEPKVMAPKTFTAPKVWRRPYTAIYNDNYRYGNSLYSGAVAEIENRSKGYTPYYSSPNSASFISDPGVRRAILEAELLTSSDILPASARESMMESMAADSALNHISSSTHHHLSSTASASMREFQSIMESSETNTGVGSGRRGSDSFNTYSSAKQLANLESGLEDARIRRRKQLSARPVSYYRSSSPFYSGAGGGGGGDQSSCDKDWTLERYYARAVRNAHRPVAFPMH